MFAASGDSGKSGLNLQLRREAGADMGERSAVRPKSGETVRQSVPALRRPTPPSTAGRKPAARPSGYFPPVIDSQDDYRPRAAGLFQRKTGRGAGQSPAIQSRRAAPCSFTSPAQSASVLPYPLEDSHIAALIEFFEMLDRWDQELHSSNSGASEVNL
jgi:hypothetical protein